MTGEIAKMMADSDAGAEAQREAWALGEYTGECPHCGRERLCICPNEKHRCEKCNWCPELNTYAPVNL